jgi:hypothetical protein
MPDSKLLLIGAQMVDLSRKDRKEMKRLEKRLRERTWRAEDIRRLVEMRRIERPFDPIKPKPRRGRSAS